MNPENMPIGKRQSKSLKWTLIIGIVIVLNLFFNYTLSLVYPSPQYEKFCPIEQVNSQANTRATCVANGGQWTENLSPATVSSGTKAAPEVQGYCNPTFTCQKNYDSASQIYDRNVFIVLVILGVASLIIGIFLSASDVVALGLSMGGVLSLLIASARYWSEAQNILKVIILAVALAALIWVGLKKFK